MSHGRDKTEPVILPHLEETCLRSFGDWSSPQASLLADAMYKSLGLYHKLPDAIRYMKGMSGKKYRYFINNFIESHADSRYLEIGSWSGSTACAAIYGNTCRITCIDNWSEFAGPRETFLHNVQQAMSDRVQFTLVDQDFRAVDYSAIGKFNVFLFDGPHSETDHYDGIVLPQPSLDDQYVLIVDDWNFSQVQEGTFKALSQLNQRIVARFEIFTRGDNYHPVIFNESSEWHCGYLIGLISKTG